MSKKGVWSSEDPRTQEWGQYCPEDNALIEKSYQGNKAPVKLDFGGAKFTVDVKAMLQSNSSGGSRRVKRDEIVTGPPPPLPAKPKQKGSSAVKTFFQKFADQNSGKLVAENFKPFFSELQINADAIDPWILFYLCNAQGCWCISDEEFEDFCMSNRIDPPTSKSIAPIITKGKQSLSNGTEYSKFFSWCYKFARNSPTANIIPTEEALEIMPLVLSVCPNITFPQQELLDFVASHAKSMSQDLWDNILTFLTTTKKDLSNFDDRKCWSVLIDDFVEYKRK